MTVFVSDKAADNTVVIAIAVILVCVAVTVVIVVSVLIYRYKVVNRYRKFHYSQRFRFCVMSYYDTRAVLSPGNRAKPCKCPSASG